MMAKLHAGMHACMQQAPTRLAAGAKGKGLAGAVQVVHDLRAKDRVWQMLWFHSACPGCTARPAQGPSSCPLSCARRNSSTVAGHQTLDLCKGNGCRLRGRAGASMLEADATRLATPLPSKPAAHTPQPT